MLIFYDHLKIIKRPAIYNVDMGLTNIKDKIIFIKCNTVNIDRLDK